MKRALAAFLPLLFVGYSVFSQNDPSLKEANSLLQSGNYNAATPIYLSLMEADPINPELNYHVGIYYLEGAVDKAKAVPHLELAKKSGFAAADLSFRLARAYHFAHRFDEAIAEYKNHIKSSSDESLNAVASRLLENCYSGKEMIRYPVNVTINNLGPTVNSEAPDYYPFVDANESILVFSSKRKKSNKGEQGPSGFFSSDIYMSVDENGEWKKPKNLGKNVNTPVNEEATGLSTNGQLMFLSIGGRGVENQMVVSHRTGTNFKAPTKVEKTINTGAVEFSSTVSLDKQTFFYASDRKGGQGGFDIYYSKRLPTNEWGKPINLGDRLNTEHDEMFPQLSPDEQTLYFASQGHSGMGGFDLFSSSLDPKQANGDLQLTWVSLSIQLMMI